LEPRATTAPAAVVERVDSIIDSVSAIARRGPSALGRNVVVAPGAPAPGEWRDAERVAVDPSAPDVEQLVEVLRAAAAERRSLVFELGDGFEAPPAGVERRPLHRVGVGHTFLTDELHHLVWSNAIDARDP